MQLSTLRWRSSCSRIVVAPRISGSIPPVLGGSGGVGVPRIFSSTHTPRSTGEVVVPFAVTFSTPASPVLHGVWVLENILGTPTPPPPPNTGGIEPDIRGAT